MRFYFFTVDHGPVEASGYEHCLIALAEGLKELGHELGGVRNYWPQKSEWLISASMEPPEAYDVVLVSNEWYQRYGKLPEIFLSKGSPKKIYLDASDGWRTQATVDDSWPADLVLRTHLVVRHRHSPKVRPWAFGLTSRIGEALKDSSPVADRAPSVLCNFRIGHPLRDLMTSRFRTVLPSGWGWDDRLDRQVPTDHEPKKLWELTGGRHYPAFYERLMAARACLAFGGYFCPSGKGSADTFLGRMTYKAMQHLHLEGRTIGQYDSWRFWESLASGAITVHVSLENYGASLPVMPEPGRDYLAYRPGMNKNDLKEALEAMSREHHGAQWAWKHYGPRAVAERLLNWISR